MCTNPDRYQFSTSNGGDRRDAFLKLHKVAEPDVPSPTSVKDDAQVLISELTKFLRPTWANEKIPKDWCNSMMIVPIYKKVDRFSI